MESKFLFTIEKPNLATAFSSRTKCCILELTFQLIHHNYSISSVMGKCFMRMMTVFLHFILKL